MHCYPAQTLALSDGVAHCFSTACSKSNNRGLVSLVIAGQLVHGKTKILTDRKNVILQVLAQRLNCVSPSPALRMSEVPQYLDYHSPGTLLSQCSLHCLPRSSVHEVLAALSPGQSAALTGPRTACSTGVFQSVQPGH